MKIRPLEKIDALSEEERLQLAEWLLTETLDRTGELVQERFGMEIPRSTLNRYRKRCEVADYLDSSAESPRARAEMIIAGASGKPDFCRATVDLLEKQAFELAQTAREEGGMEALATVFGLIDDHKKTVVRERVAAVQEWKAKLREEELALKKAGSANKPAEGAGEERDDLGPYATSYQGIRARARAKFGFRREGAAAAVPGEQAEQKNCGGGL
jgi:hypothetical protein